jgi:hypothetical protein
MDWQPVTAEEAPGRGGLDAVMVCMRDIRRRTERTEAMFGALTSTLSLLGKYHIAVPPEV